MNGVIGTLLMLVGIIQFAAARDRLLWNGHAVESFRYCLAFGYSMLGARFWWIVFFGDEPGVSLWSQASLISMGIGHLGLQMNNLSSNTIHVPKFIRRSIE